MRLLPSISVRLNAQFACLSRTYWDILSISMTHMLLLLPLPLPLPLPSPLFDYFLKPSPIHKVYSRSYIMCKCTCKSFSHPGVVINSLIFERNRFHVNTQKHRISHPTNEILWVWVNATMKSLIPFTVWQWRHIYLQFIYTSQKSYLEFGCIKYIDIVITFNAFAHTYTSHRHT